MDKRVLRTKESIKTAFMQLMLESELEKITISDIAEMAGINRSTFYLHYGDAVSVIEEIDREFATEINASIKNFTLSDIHGSIYNIFTYLTSMLENKEVKKSYIIYSSDSANIANKLKNIIVEKSTEAILNAFPWIDKSETVYPLTFAAAGIVETYIKWVRDNSVKVTLSELIDEVALNTQFIIERLTKKQAI